MLFCKSCCGACLSAPELLLLRLAEALLFWDPVTKFSREDDPAAVLLVPLVCALFQADSGTVAMTDSVAVLGFLALLLNDADAVVESAFWCCLLVIVETESLLFCGDDGALIQCLFVHQGELFSFVMQQNK